MSQPQPEKVVPAKRRATYEDLCQVPDHKVAELIDGELIVSPRPASPHALAGYVLGNDLFGFHRPKNGPGGPGGWWILFEPELHFAENVLVPDLAGWRRERMPRFPHVAAFELAPDWVCEVVSPTTARVDRIRKLRIYARDCISHAWIVDPLAQTLEVYALEAGTYALVASFEGTEKVRAAPFDAALLDMARWWIETAP